MDSRDEDTNDRGPGQRRPSLRGAGAPVSGFTVVNELLGRYRIVVWLAVALGIAAGFGFRTPESRFKSLEARVSSLEAERGETARLVRSLAKAKCLESTEREWQLLDLPCNQLLSGLRP